MSEAWLDQKIAAQQAASQQPSASSVPAVPSAPVNKQSIADSLLQGGVDAVPGLKQLSAYLESHAPSALTNGKNQTYQQNLKQDEADSLAASDQHPVAHTLGQIGVSGLEMAYMPSMGVTGKILAPAVKNAVLGAAQGASDSDAEGYSPEEDAKSAALNGIISGGLGGLGGAIDSTLGKGVDRLRRAGVGLDRSGNTQLYDINDPDKLVAASQGPGRFSVPRMDGESDADYQDRVLKATDTLNLAQNNASTQTNSTANKLGAGVGKVITSAAKGVLPGGATGAILGAESDKDDPLGGAIKYGLLGGIGGGLLEASIPAIQQGTSDVIKPPLTGLAKVTGRLLGGQHLTDQGAENAISKLADRDKINSALGFDLQDFKNNPLTMDNLPDSITSDPDKMQQVMDYVKGNNQKVSDLEAFLGKSLPVNFQDSLLINKSPIIKPAVADAMGNGFNALTQGTANTVGNDITQEPVNDTNPMYSTGFDASQPGGVDAVSAFLSQAQPGADGQLGQ